MREPARASRVKRHRLLLVLDEFPQLGRMGFFEVAMAAMAGYGMKAFLVCQSFNHITRAYGRDNVIIDNCHVVTAFAAADIETAKRIADMTGEVWEMRAQESDQRPRSFFGPRKGSTTYREERRALMTPGEVRLLPREEQLIFVAGAKPVRARKIAFDRMALFARRLRPASGRACVLTTTHDWVNVAALGQADPAPTPALEASGRNAGARARDPSKGPGSGGAQADLFTPGPARAPGGQSGRAPSQPAPEPLARSMVGESPIDKTGV